MMFGIGAAMSAVNAAQRVTRNLERATQRDRRRRRRGPGPGEPAVVSGPVLHATPRRFRRRTRSWTALWVLSGAGVLFGLCLLQLGIL